VLSFTSEAETRTENIRRTNESATPNPTTFFKNSLLIFPPKPPIKNELSKKYICLCIDNYYKNKKDTLFLEK
jgi:hypothetical protein